MYYMLVILLLPAVLHAGELDNCTRLRDSNQKNLCLALATLNVNQCDRMIGLEQRAQCVSQVREGQRRLNSFHALDSTNSKFK